MNDSNATTSVGPSSVPCERWVWEATAAGVESLRMVRRTLPSPKADEVLVRIDAVGICASDVKILRQGPAHPRLAGRDLAADPVVLGHEVSLTVLKPGADRAEQFPFGSRWVINPEIFVDGVNMQYGFKIPGGYQEYQVLPAAVLDGGALPVPACLGWAQAALTEPWACVYFAYGHHRPTRGVLPGGTAWYIGAGPVGMMHIEKGIADRARRVVVSEVNPTRRERVNRLLGASASAAGVELILLDDEAAPDPILGPSGADDIVISAPDPRTVLHALRLLGRRGVLNIFAGFPERSQAVLPVDFFDLHYRNATIISTSGTELAAMRSALSDSAAGRFNANRAVAAVGGLDAVAEGMIATAAGRFPGRVVIYPGLRMPLTPVESLTADGVWSVAAEAQLFTTYGCRD